MRLPLRIPIGRDHPLARLLCRGDIAALTLGADGRLAIERRDGSAAEAAVDPATTVFPWLVVLRCRIDGQRESFVLPPQATGAAAHRRLRVWLDWRVRVA
jgi:hypothetical protein